MEPINPAARTTAARRAEIDDQAILERATDALLIVDAASRIVALNPAAVQLLGSSHATLIGEPLEHLLVPTHDAADAGATADVSAGTDTAGADAGAISVAGARTLVPPIPAAPAAPAIPPAPPHGELGLTYLVTDASGHLHPVAVRLYPLPHADGFRYAITLRPTGPQTRTPHELLFDKRFRDAALDRLPGLFFVVDAEHRFKLWNRHLERITGHAATELPAMRADHELPAVADRPRVAQALAAARKVGTSSVEFDLLARGGRPVRHQATIRQFELGGREYFVGLGIDITGHKHLEEALRLEKELARRFLDIAGTINVVIGADGSILTLNRKGGELLECDESESIGLNWFDTFLPERLREEVRGVFDCLMRGEIELVEYHENPICTASGRERIIAWQNSVVTDKDGDIIGTLSSGLDITDRQQAEEALRMSETALRRSHEEIRDLAGRLLRAQEEERRRIARDLHDGLNQTLALLSVELEQVGQKPPTSPAEISNQMQALCARVRELSSDVHRLSHQLHPAKLEYLGLVAAIRSFCDGLAAQVGLQVEFIHPEEQPTPPGDVALCLYRIVQESLRNVIKHSGARTVRVELDRIDTGLQLRISDTGVGFTPEGIRERGGLGLISMEERLRLVGGELSIDSRPAGGTCIEARVPLESGAWQRRAHLPGSDR